MIIMSVANKLQTIAENQQKVYDAGYAEGKQAEYDEFWNSFQNNGNARPYRNAFAGFTENAYNPKFPINATTIEGMYNFNTYLTDTKVPIITTGTAVSAFRWASEFVTIRELTVSETSTLTDAFLGLSKLQNLTIGGVIGKSISIPSSVLTLESAKSVIMHLKNYAGTDNEFVYTVTFHANVWALLDADDTAPNGLTWREYINSIGWNA